MHTVLLQFASVSAIVDVVPQLTVQWSWMHCSMPKTGLWLRWLLRFLEMNARLKKKTYVEMRRVIYKRKSLQTAKSGFGISSEAAAFSNGGVERIRTSAPVTQPNDLANRPLKPLEYHSMAERVGFEPTVPCDITGFQDQLLKPLGHLSVT